MLHFGGHIWRALCENKGAHIIIHGGSPPGPSKTQQPPSVPLGDVNYNSILDEVKRGNMKMMQTNPADRNDDGYTTRLLNHRSVHTFGNDVVEYICIS